MPDDMNRNIDEGGASPQLSLKRPPMGRFELVEVVFLPSRAEPHDGAGEACRPKQPAVRGQPFEILPKTCRYISPDDQFRLEISGLFFESALQGEENRATTVGLRWRLAPHPESRRTAFFETGRMAGRGQWF